MISPTRPIGPLARDRRRSLLALCDTLPDTRTRELPTETGGVVSEAGARDSWRRLRDRLDSEAERAKSSLETTIRLSAAYANLGEEKRPAVNAELLEWLKNDDEALRFDALALIREHRITAAEPALDDLVRRLGTDARPGAPYEQQKILRSRGTCGRSTHSPPPVRLIEIQQ
jgi:hypothetical protein